MKELCVRCGMATPYNQSTSITLRRYYVEGSGQLCQDCFQYLYLMPGSLGSKNLPRQGGDDNVSENPNFCSTKQCVELRSRTRMEG